jgi:hypothetical protein
LPTGRASIQAAAGWRYQSIVPADAAGAGVEGARRTASAEKPVRTIRAAMVVVQDRARIKAVDLERDMVLSFLSRGLRSDLFGSVPPVNMEGTLNGLC